MNVLPSADPAWRPREEQEAGEREEKKDLPVGEREQRDRWSRKIRVHVLMLLFPVQPCSSPATSPSLIWNIQMPTPRPHVDQMRQW